MSINKCEGFSINGYCKGDPCGNKAQYKGNDGRMYCHTHIGIANHTPERLDKLRDKWDIKQRHNGR